MLRSARSLQQFGLLESSKSKEHPMSDEPEIKDGKLSEDELKQVAGGKPAATVATPALKIEGIKGESLDDKHKDEIEVL
jgi:hypothetical protein